MDFTGWLSFDLECNMANEGSVRGPFHKRATRLLCIVTEDVVTNEKKVFDIDNIEEGLDFLLSSKGLIAHNGKGFDIKVISHLYPALSKKFKNIPIADTLMMSRQLFGKDGTKLLEYDLKKFNKTHKQPHSLRNWGDRLKFPKMDDFVDADWEKEGCSKELIEYCRRDVDITTKLFHYLLKKRTDKNDKKKD